MSELLRKETAKIFVKIYLMEYWGILGTEDKVQNEKETLEDVLIVQERLLQEAKL